MDWKHIFNKAVGSAPDPERVKELKRLNAQMHEEWVVYSLQEYITHFSLLEEDIKLLETYCVECEKFYLENKKLRKYHFGYPANLLRRSLLYDVFTEYERTGFLANNCGDTFETAYYKMDSKKVEKSILRMFADKFDISKLSYWGYITSGGSESNAWGIENGFNRYPEGILYFCESAHYSVKKHANRYRHICIPQMSPVEEAINTDALFSIIKANLEPVILFLTWGTTKFGSCDDILKIVYWLKAEDRDFYLHVDAALYGGIPNNQLDAPIIRQIGALGVNSISVSLHKYIGTPCVKSVLLTTEKPNAEIVSYIGVTDSTTSGSRDIFPFSMRQQVFDVLKLTNECEYKKNIIYFEQLLKDYSISYNRSGNGNIFVIDKPTDELCRKYQLSTFDITLNSGQKVNKAHIIIFPYQEETVIRELVNDLSRKGDYLCGKI